MSEGRMSICDVLEREVSLRYVCVARCLCVGYLRPQSHCARSPGAVSLCEFCFSGRLSAGCQVAVCP